MSKVKNSISLNDLFNEKGRMKGYLKFIRFSAEEKNDPKSVLLHLRGAFNLRGNATYELGEQEAYDCFKKLEEQDIHRHPKDIRKFEKTKSALWWAATSLKRYKEQNGLPLETPEL